MRLSLALALAIAIAIAASAPVSASAGEQRDLQDSVACLATGGDFAACCPAASEGADPDDGVCTLLTCLDLSGGGASIRDVCSCADVVAGCGQVAAFAGVVPQLPDMCASVGACCADDDGDGATTANADWDACMAEAEEAGDHELPDFSALVPGGVPVFGEEPGVQTTETTVVPEIADDGGMALPSTTTAVPATTGDDVAVATTTAVPATEEVASTVSAFSPPPSIMCLAGALSGAGGSSFVDCCPEATPDDGICTMLWCIDITDLSVKDGCACAQLETSCAQLADFGDLVPNMPEACAAVAECCADDGSTAGGDFDSCMGGKGLTPPDFASLVPGGLPEELGGEPAAEEETDATEAPPATEEEETETTTVPATEAPVPPAATGGGAGRSAGAALAASALVAVACSALVRV
jgi:hypothetical protein